MNSRLALFAASTTLAAGIVSAPLTLAGDWEGIESVPGHSPVTVIVEELPRNYFLVTSQAPLVLTLEGPMRLRLISRVELPKGSSDVATYVLRVTDGGTLLDDEHTESSASEDARLPAGEKAVGKSRRLDVEIAPGIRKITVATEGASPVLVRLMQASPSRRNESWVTLTPVSASRSVSVKEAQLRITYASVLPGEPVRLRVQGPTTLDVTSRLDFDPTMRGEQTYRLAFSENGKTILERSMTTTKSATAVYRGLKNRVPSKFDRTALPVEAGMHEISIQLLQPVKGSAEIHARIPEPQVGHHE